MNLFWSTRSLTECREDHLTEFFAAALETSPSFRRSYADLLLADFANSKKWAAPEIVEIKTQVSFEGTTCCPDMILKLSDDKIIGCEHKLDALETLGPAQDERGQLERYLDLPIDGLAYVRSSWKQPEGYVLDHPKYIRPRVRVVDVTTTLQEILGSAPLQTEGIESKLLGFVEPLLLCLQK